jgi:hypothetical protein
VHTYSSLTFKAVVAQNGFEIGSAARITTVIREYEAPATGNSKVWAEIEHPDGTNSVESLPATNSGQYGTAIGLQQPGIYRIRVRAHGETQRGLPFEREQTLTAIAAPGGRDPWESENSRTSELCELLHCLEKGKGIREDLIKRLEEIGIDFHALLKCLREKCRSTSEILETRKSRSEISAPGVGPGYTTNEVLEVLTQMLSKTRGGC